MTDLISRQDVINAVLLSNFSACTVYGRSEEGMATAKELIQAIKNLPSVQTDVVRCKDCKFYEIYELKADNTDDKRYKPSVCVKGMFAVKRSENWFCADAKRRTDE